MYADRYVQPTRFNPGGLTAAVLINAAVIAALLFSAPHIASRIADKPITIYAVPVEPPPPPQPQPLTPQHQQQAARPNEQIDLPVPPMPVPSTDFSLPLSPPLPPAGPVIGTDTGPAVDAAPATPIPLPLVDPAIDARYASQFQPIYPAAERRAGREGKVMVRVLVGMDGRVKQAERVSATSDAFWQATFERAMGKWRFRPGTRGGVPVEAWRTLTLTFVLED
jgi:protein TonB